MRLQGVRLLLSLRSPVGYCGALVGLRTSAPNYTLSLGIKLFTVRSGSLNVLLLCNTHSIYFINPNFVTPDEIILPISLEREAGKGGSFRHYPRKARLLWKKPF